MIHIRQQPTYGLAHPTEPIYYRFTPLNDEDDTVRVVRTGKVGRRWQHEYEMTRKEARALYASLRKQGYDKF